MPPEEVVSEGVGLVDEIVGDVLGHVEVVTNGVGVLLAANPDVRVAATAAAAPPPTKATVATPAAMVIERS